MAENSNKPCLRCAQLGIKTCNKQQARHSDCDQCRTEKAITGRQFLCQESVGTTANVAATNPPVQATGTTEPGYDALQSAFQQGFRQGWQASSARARQLGDELLADLEKRRLQPSTSSVPRSQPSQAYVSSQIAREAPESAYPSSEKAFQFPPGMLSKPTQALRTNQAGLEDEVEKMLSELLTQELLDVRRAQDEDEKRQKERERDYECRIATLEAQLEDWQNGRDTASLKARGPLSHKTRAQNGSRYPRPQRERKDRSRSPDRGPRRRFHREEGRLRYGDI